MNMIDPERRKSPEEFAEEILGSADEQLYAWYERQIAWREEMVKQYNQELDVLEAHFKPVIDRIEERARLADEQTTNPPPVTDPDLGKKLAALPGGVTGLVDVKRTPDGGETCLVEDPNATQAMPLPSMEADGPAVDA